VSEVWIPVPGFEGCYEVSNHGRVRSIRRKGAPGGLIAQRLGSGGYRSVGLCRHGRTRIVRVHILVLSAFAGPRPSGQVVRHLDGNPENNHLGNLAWGTYGDNLDDSVAHGTHAMAARKHCPNGHPYEGRNLYVYKSGRRACRACLRARGNGRDPATEPTVPRNQRSADRTHCPNGHPYIPENTITSSGRRKCKACHRARAAGRDPKSEPIHS
jgi:hypothetical protein